MNNLVSSNPFKTYIGTIRVRKKNPHGFQLVFQSPCPRSFFKKTTKPTHFTVEKKISEKNPLSPETKLSPKNSPIHLQFAVEVFWEDWRHIALDEAIGRFGCEPTEFIHLPPYPLVKVKLLCRLVGGRWLTQVMCWKRISHGKLTGLPNPDAPCVLFF